MSIKGNAESFIELRGSLSLPEAIQGKSAYEIAVMHGFDGTEEEYVQWLKYGKDGKDGADGITPHIGENGNWWIGDKDTGVASVTPVPYTFGTTDLVEGKSELPTGHLYFVYEPPMIQRKVTVQISEDFNGVYNEPDVTTISMYDDGNWYKADREVKIGSRSGIHEYSALAIPYVMYDETTGQYSYKYEVTKIFYDLEDDISVGGFVTPRTDHTAATIEDVTEIKRKKITVTMTHGAVQENGANVVSSTTVSMVDDLEWYKGDETILIGDYEGGGAIYKAMAYPYVMYNEGRGTYDWKFEIAEIIMDTMSLHSVGEIITSFPNGTYVAIEDAKDESAIITRAVTVTCPANASYEGDTGVTVIEMADDGKEYRTLGTVPVGEYFGAGMSNRGKAMVLAKYNKTTKAYDYRFLIVESTPDSSLTDMGGVPWEVGKIYTISATVTLTDITE